MHTGITRYDGQYQSFERFLSLTILIYCPISVLDLKLQCKNSHKYDNLQTFQAVFYETCCKLNREQYIVFQCVA